MASTSFGTYMLRVGDLFYIGSTTSFVKRGREHLWRLKAGKHLTKKLQKAYDDGALPQMIPLDYFRYKGNETTSELRDRLRAAEQAHLDKYYDDPCCTNSSRNTRGPDNGELMKELWKDPEWREWMSEKVRGRKASPEARRKMAEAKKGRANARSRQIVVVGPDGKKKAFPTVSSCAEFFGASQQSMHLWITGEVPWPGTGRNKLRPGRELVASYSLVSKGRGAYVNK